jgi:hypothetical protein
MNSIPSTKPWAPHQSFNSSSSSSGAIATTATTVFKKKPQPQISIPMNAPSTFSKEQQQNYSPRKHSRRRVVMFYHLVLTWFFLFIVTCLAVGAYFFPHPSPPSLSLEKNDIVAAKNDLTTAAAGVKIYPFNVYDDNAKRVVRYPPTGAIPQLYWNRVKHYRACCKDEDSLRCFATHEIALRRDINRTQKRLSDVYLEIMRDAEPETVARWKRLGSLGSRCQLIWSEEHAEIES